MPVAPTVLRWRCSRPDIVEYPRCSSPVLRGYRLSVHTTDATDTELLGIRCYGFLMALLYHESRTHLSLDKDAPESRGIQANKLERIVQISQVGGLHHRYERRAS